MSNSEVGESSSSYGNSSNDDFLMGDATMDEEERLLIENEQLMMEQEEEYLTDVIQNLASEEDMMRIRQAEIREMRFKRLMHLLNSSKMYSEILKSKIKDEGNERKNSSSQDSIIKRQGSATDYNVADVLTEQQIDETVAKDNNKAESETLEKDYFNQTKVTTQGYTVSYKQPDLLEGGIMRDYQLRGLEWMINLFMNGVNGILADEMGLGKTIQVISFICHMIEQDIKGPFLIVAPLSTVTNWMNEFKRFAPKVPTMLYYGNEAERRDLLPEIFQLSKVGKYKAHKVVITSYSVPMRDKAQLGKINWYYLIIDEGHRIKNHNSLLTRTLKEFNTVGRLLLTGTPLQNNLSELWSLLNFLLPEIFSSLDVFEAWFDVRELEKNGAKFMREQFNIDVVNMLREILIPFLLRREKKDVNLQLPPKKEILIYCPLTQRQKELYQATLDKSIEALVKPKDDVLGLKEPLPKRRCFVNSPYGRKTKPNQPKRREASPIKDEERFSTNIVLANPQMQLRKIVNHPYLIQYPLIPGTEDLRIDEDLVKVSGKLLVLDALLAKLKHRGHKVVLFSHFKIVLDILEDYAHLRNYSYCRLDGSCKISDRDEEILKFVSDPDVFLFLISIRTGGLGINLTAADTVIFYDSDWNPQMNLQSQDRCHRIGQTKPVVVYRLCVSGTVDENIIMRGNAKRRLEKMILQKGKHTQNSKSLKMDLQELKELLESTDHDTAIKSNGFVFTDEELETLLDRTKICSDTLSSTNDENKVFKVLHYEN